MKETQKIDLSVLNKEPVYEGSVQDLFALELEGKEFFLSRTSESGSVFDVGTIFTVPDSGMLRTAVRHHIYTSLSDPATWRDLKEEDVRACYDRDEIVSDLLRGELLGKLRKSGVSTHHAGMVDRETGQVVTGRMPDKPSSLVLVERFPVYKPDRFELWGRYGWEYHEYLCAKRKVIALEHVFRLGAPGGSSLLSRYAAARKEGADAAQKLLVSLGLDGEPEPWGVFKNMIYDCTTKYEPSDRSLTWQETIHLSGVGGDIFKRVVKTLVLCTVYVRKFFGEMGFQLWDIKWECAVDGDRVVVVDTIDPDSIRVTGTTEHQGRRVFIHFNKQAIRDYYKLIHPEWYDSINRAKKLSKNDPQGRDFMTIYREKVSSGEFPDIPEVDPEFSNIQSRKYAVMVEPLTGAKKKEESLSESEELMKKEIEYFSNKGVLDGFLDLNAG